MIVLTSLNGEAIGINEELIAKVEADPQTRIFLTNGDCLVVGESMTEVGRRIRTERAETTLLARALEERARHIGPETRPPRRSERTVVPLHSAAQPSDTGSASNR